MEKAFVVDIPIYERDLLVVFGSKDFLVSQLSQAYGMGKAEAYSLIADIDGHSLGRYYFNIERNARFLWMPDTPDTPKKHATLSHEILHATFGIMSEIGASPSESSEEAYAYLTGYLTKEIYESFSDAHAP